MKTAETLTSEALKVFESVPDLYLILSPELTILTASDAYLAATFTTREEIMNKHVFDAFPDNPATGKATGVKDLRDSLELVLKTHKPHQMELQRYDVRQTKEASKRFVTKYWQPLNTPVLDEQGEVQYIIHKVEDVTEQVLRAQQLEREAQEERRGSEELLRKSEAVGQLGSYEGDLATMRFHFSDNMFRLLGFEPCSFTPTLDAIDAISVPEDAEEVRQIIEQAVKDRSAYQYQRRIYWPDGEMRYITSRGNVVCDKEGKPTKIFGIAQDTTEQVKAQEQLQRNEQQYRTLLDNTPDAITRWDKNLKLVFANAAFETKTGVSNATLLGKSNSEMGQPDEVALPWMEKLQKVFNTGEAVIHYNAFPSPGGTSYFQSRLVPEKNAAGEVETVLAIARDITELRKSEEKLKEANQKLERSNSTIRQMLDGSIASICVFESKRDESGQLVDFIFRGTNKTSEIINQRTEEELLGRGLVELFPGVKEVFFEDYARVVETGEPLRTVRQYTHEHYGQDAWFDVSAVKNGDGFILTFLDVTEQKRAEQELQESKAFAEQITSTTPDLITIYDVAANHVSYANHEDFWKGSYDKQVHQLHDVQRIEAMIYPDDREKAKVFLKERNLLADDEVKEIELRMTGKIEWIQVKSKVFKRDGAGNATFIISFVSDITAKKKAEQELHKQYQILRQAEEVALMGSWEYDIASKTFHWSEGMYRLFGLPAGSPVSQQTYLNHVLEEDYPKIERFFLHLQGGREPLEETVRIKTGGRLHVIKIKIAVLLSPKGVAEKLLGVDLDITEVNRLEQENLQMRLEQQKTLLFAILEAQEEERRRIAEALHNGVGQLLYATRLTLERIAPHMQRQEETELEAFKAAERLLTEAINETRVVSHELVPVLLQKFGLKEALHDLCRRYEQSTLYVHCTVEGLQERLESHLEVAIYRISQELINNVIRHAQATGAALLLRKQKDQVLLQLRDNGKGFTYDPSQAKGLGLKAIEDRVKLLNGTLSVTTPKAGKGTLVAIQIPLQA